MKIRIAASVLILTALLAIGCGKKEGTVGGSEWVTFDAGMAQAAREEKPVVIDFYTSWCRWCKVMDEKTFSRTHVSKYLSENFVAIRIDSESRKVKLNYKGKTYTPVELTRFFGVRGYPSLAYLDRNGDLITVVPGYVPPERFLPFLRYINKGCYKQEMTFEEFLKRNEEC